MSIIDHEVLCFPHTQLCTPSDPQLWTGCRDCPRPPLISVAHGSSHECLEGNQTNRLSSCRATEHDQSTGKGPRGRRYDVLLSTILYLFWTRSTSSSSTLSS